MKPVTYKLRGIMTIREVARLAGVSKTTVSRVLNNNGYVNTETREKIETIIEATDYTPSAAAVNLSTSTSKSISVIIPEIANSFFGELMAGISEVAQNTDYALTYSNTDNNLDLEEQAVKMAQKQDTCGIIITPARGFFDEKSASKLTAMYERLHVPIIVVDRGFDSSKWDGVFYENFQSTYIATKELIGAGHRNIGIITGDLNLLIGRDRKNGYIAAMEESGYYVDRNYMLGGDFTANTAYEVTKNMFASGNFPEAMVTSNNYTSLGFIKACTEYGLTIGKDIAVIGIDHIPALDSIDYPLSVVTRDAVEMGRTAMHMLLERLKNPDAPKRISMIPCELRLRGSEKLIGKGAN